MERLTSKRSWEEAGKELGQEYGYSHIWKRLNQIEDILGDTYDLDRLRVIVEADKAGRCVLLPCKDWRNLGFGHSAMPKSEVLVMAMKYLRPITREQVEKVWRGCEKCNGAGEYSRYAENLTKILLAKYCPHCGRPLTDAAWEMLEKRLEVRK